MTFNKDAFVEAVKEILRVAFLAAVTAVLGYLGNLVAGLDPSSVYYVVGTVVLRAVDKYIHVNPDTKLKGLSPV